MAEAIIPLPDANGYWHFTYRTTDTLDGRWYGGKRSTKKHPLSDPYKGSGNWVRAHPARDRLQREIVAFYASSAEVFTGEAELVTWFDVWDDLLCMNERPGGDGMSIETACILGANPDVRAKKSASAFKRETNPGYRAERDERCARLAADPEWQAAHAARLRRMHANPEIRAKIAAGCRRTGPDPIVRAKKSAAATRREADPDYRVRRDAAMKRRGENGEWRARQSPAAILREAARSPEEVTKITARLTASRRTPEARANNRAAQLRVQAAKRAAKALLLAAE